MNSHNIPDNLNCLYDYLYHLGVTPLASYIDEIFCFYCNLQPSYSIFLAYQKTIYKPMTYIYI